MASGAMASGALIYSGNSSRSNFTFSAAARGIAFAVGTDNGQSVAVLKDFFVIKDGPIPAVPLVGGEGDQTGDPVFAFNVLVRQHLEDARAFFPLQKCQSL